MFSMNLLPVEVYSWMTWVEMKNEFVDKNDHCQMDLQTFTMRIIKLFI